MPPPQTDPDNAFLADCLLASEHGARTNIGNWPQVISREFAALGQPGRVQFRSLRSGAAAPPIVGAAAVFQLFLRNDDRVHYDRRIGGDHDWIEIDFRNPVAKFAGKCVEFLDQLCNRINVASGFATNTEQ